MKHPKFDIVVMIVIMMNTATMCLDHYDQTSEFTFYMEIFNDVFVAFFMMEMLLKLIAYRWYYFKEPWNDFDCAIVVLSVVSSIFVVAIAVFY